MLFIVEVGLLVMIVLEIPGIVEGSILGDLFLDFAVGLVVIIKFKFEPDGVFDFNLRLGIVVVITGIVGIRVGLTSFKKSSFE